MDFATYLSDTLEKKRKELEKQAKEAKTAERKEVTEAREDQRFDWALQDRRKKEINEAIASLGKRNRGLYTETLDDLAEYVNQDENSFIDLKQASKGDSSLLENSTILWMPL